MRRDLPGQSGRCFACLGGLFPGLIAFGLGGGEAFGYEVRFGRCLLALPWCVSRSASALACTWSALVAACASLVALGTGLVGVLVRPVQLRAQLAGAALDRLGAGLGRVCLLWDANKVSS